MFECKCLKNLTGFFIAKPPCVVFTLCLATFAVGLVSLGLYVLTHDFPETDPSKDWYSLITKLSQVSLCVPPVFPNRSEETSQNHTINPSTDQHLHYHLINVSIPLMISFFPFGELMDNNYTQITTYLSAGDLGIKDKYEMWHKVNLTVGIENMPVDDLCATSENCNPITVEACVTLSAPASILPPISRSPEKCANSSLPKQIQNIHASYILDMPSQPKQLPLWCEQGVILRTKSPQNSQIMQSSLSSDEQTKANLHLQYSSYVLFVMVITCVVYAMIKGKPVKSSPKKVNQLI